jgi:DNA N-6-adenine-methyltransferase Dam
MAKRAHAHAVRRVGELLEEVERSKGGRPPKETQEGALPSFEGRAAAAEKAGLSEHQRKQALNLAAIPAPEFKEAVDAPSPPTVTKLAAAGRTIGLSRDGRLFLRGGDSEWYTPPELVERARTVLGDIDLDPASHPEAQKIVRAKRWYGVETDGLTQPWAGRVFLNPPYSRDVMGQFVDKLLAEIASGHVAQAIVLTPVRCDTGWWHQLTAAASAIAFVKGRIKFWRSEGQPECGAIYGSVFFFIGEDCAGFRRCFGEVCSVVPAQWPQNN